MARRPQNAIHTIAHSLPAALLLALLVLTGGWLYLLQHGGRLLAIPTANMVPAIPAHAAVIVWPAEPTNLPAGGIIAYQQGDGGAITVSRLIRADRSTGQVIVRGDHSPKPEPALAASLVIGQVGAVLPLAGPALGVLRRPPDLIVIVYLPALAVLVSELNRLSKHYARPFYRLFGYSSGKLKA